MTAQLLRKLNSQQFEIITFNLSLIMVESSINTTPSTAAEDPTAQSQRQSIKKKDAISPVIQVMGEQIMRKELHQDPFVNKELDLEADKKLKLKEKVTAKAKESRESLRQTVIDQTVNRFKHVLRDKVSDEDVKYCTEPLIQLLEQQSKLVEDSRVEIDGLQKILDSKQLDIAKLSNENDKFMQLSQGKKAWREYELLLAKERIVNRRLMAMLAERDNEELLKEGRKNTYQEWIDQKSKMGTGNHNGTVYPRRRLSPRY